MENIGKFFCKNKNKRELETSKQMRIQKPLQSF